MCTVSFVPNENGFLLGMNRDESQFRPIALPPEVHGETGEFSIYPSEPGGGTWIGINNSGLCLALINWHAVPTRPFERVVSRGIVVEELIQSRASNGLFGLLQELPIEQMPPFRLMAFSLRESIVSEFRWDQNRVNTVSHRWEAKHWFSSGLDEQRVEMTRGEVCREAWSEVDAGELSWLRRLHRSHLPARGGFSLCMHREDAFTVSYTEVVFCGAGGTMRYHPGPLCGADGKFFEKAFSFTPRQSGAKPLDNP
jgi:Transport and Golgi organisation 2